VASPKPKRHHYLPRSYLNRFTRSGKLWVYDRQEDKYLHQTPHNTAVIGHYYSITTPAGEKDTELEGVLAQVEGVAQRVIAKADSGADISPQEKADLAYFIAWLYARVPEFQETYDHVSEQFWKLVARQTFATVEATERILREHPAGTDYPSLTAEKLHAFVHGDDYTVKTHRHLSLLKTIESAQDLWEYFVQMDWIFCHAEAGSHYVTSDTPFCLLPPRVKTGPAWMGTGLLTPGAGKFIPLTATTALLMGDRGDRIVHRDTEAWRVKDANLAVTVRCLRYLLGQDKAVLRDLVETTKIAGTRLKPRIRTM
jgi:Protein of unknown function (DUF4238)